MSTDINLLPQKKLGAFSQEKILSFSKIAAIILLVLTISLSLLFFLLSRDPTLDNLHTQENSVLAKLSLLHNKTAKDLLVLNRLKGISAILKDRGAMDTIISVFQKQFPADVSVNAFSLDQKSFSFTIVSTNASSLGIVIDNFQKLLSEKKLIKKLTIQGLITDEKGGKYLLTISGDML